MKKIFFALCMFLSLSTLCHAKDVTNFSVRGVSPSMNSSKSCDMLAGYFMDEPEMRDKLGMASNKDWMFSIDRYLHKGSSSHQKGCRAGYKVYDKSIGGAMTKTDHIEVKSQNGQVYYVNNKQTLNVGGSINDCKSRRSKMVSGLIGKYGKPTTQREDAKRGATFVHAIWDFSDSPSARIDDDGHEKFEAYIQCDMYSHKTSFAQMKLETSVHSGKAIQQSRNMMKAKKTFEPIL